MENRKWLWIIVLLIITVVFGGAFFLYRNQISGTSPNQPKENKKQENVKNGSAELTTDSESNFLPKVEYLQGTTVEEYLTEHYADYNGPFSDYELPGKYAKSFETVDAVGRVSTVIAAAKTQNEDNIVVIKYAAETDRLESKAVDTVIEKVLNSPPTPTPTTNPAGPPSATPTPAPTKKSVPPTPTPTPSTRPTPDPTEFYKQATECTYGCVSEKRF